MKFESDAWQSTVSVALLHAERPAVMIQLEGDKGVVPSLSRPFKNWLKIETELVHDISEYLGVKVSPLYLLDYHCDPEKRFETLLLVCEAAGPGLPLAGNKMAWWGCESLRHGTLKNETRRELLRSMLQDLETGFVPENRPDWGKKGWRRGAERWIESCFEKRPDEIQSVETLSLWNVACLLKIKGRKRTYYFKASPNFPCFVNEGHVMKGLAQWAPRIVPEPLFVHESQNWMILEDLGQPCQSTDTQGLAAIVERLGTLQVDAVKQGSALNSLNLPISTLQDLRSEVKDLFGCDEAKDGLSDEEQAALGETWPLVEEKICQLEDYSLPLTLNHGDLHLGNVIFRNGEWVIFDWTWASISHPFFDLILLYLRNQENWAQVAPAYFKQWSDREPLKRCLEAWKLAYPLGLLRMASRYRGFVVSLEKPTLNGFPKPVAHFLRHFLVALKSEAN